MNIIDILTKIDSKNVIPFGILLFLFCITCLIINFVNNSFSFNLEVNNLNIMISLSITFLLYGGGMRIFNKFNNTCVYEKVPLCNPFMEHDVFFDNYGVTWCIRIHHTIGLEPYIFGPLCSKCKIPLYSENKLLFFKTWCCYECKKEYNFPKDKNITFIKSYVLDQYLKKLKNNK